MLQNRHLIRVFGISSLLGSLTGLLLIIAFSQKSWGPPGTEAYQTYELLNRIMAFSLLLMSTGWLGIMLLLPQGFGRWAV